MKLLILSLAFMASYAYTAPNSGINSEGSFGMANNTQSHLNNYILEATPDVRLEIVWGRVKKGCFGYGICKVRIITEGRDDVIMAKQSSGSGIADFTMIAGQLTMEVYKATLTEDTDGKYFGASQFKVEEAFSVPADVAAELGQNYTIEIGDYNIQESEDKYIVVF